MRGNIEIIASGFSGNYGHLNGTQNLLISYANIFRSLLTVGTRGIRDFLRLPWHVLTARGGRAIFSGNFITVIHGNWVIRGEYRTQDRSEKAVLSYWLGLSISKVIAGRLLDTPWLAHVDALIEDNVITPANLGGQRPDLAGPDRMDNWHIVEAKGRSVFIEPGLMQNAKNQALMIIDADGSPPLTRSGSIVKLYSNPIQVIIEDPDQDTGKVRWTIDRTAFYEKYYSTILRYLRRSESSVLEFGEYTYHVSEIRLFGQRLRVGLLDSIIENPASVIDRAEELHSIDELSKDLPSDISRGRDGTYLKLVSGNE